MRTYRIDAGNGKTTVRFWLDSRHMALAACRGIIQACREFRLLSRKPLTFFTVTQES